MNTPNPSSMFHEGYPGALAAPILPVPTVAVIVPCRNEKASIVRFLEEVLASDYERGRMEVLIVDGMSDDGTREVLLDYQHRHSILRVLDNPSRTQACALNIGIQNSASDIVVRLDVRSEYQPDYISRLVRTLVDQHADNVGGLRLTHAGASAWSHAVASLVSHPFASGGASWRSGARGIKTVDTVYCGCYRRSVFDRVGLFNERMNRGEDREFNLRLAAAGGIILLDPSIRCSYFPRTRLIPYCTWVFSGPLWIFSSRAFTRTSLTSFRNFVPAAFLLYHCIPALAYLTAPALFVPSLVPVALYWGLNVFFSVKESARYRSWAVAPMLIGGFFLTHVIYGIASMVGAAVAAVDDLASWARHAHACGQRAPKESQSDAN